MPPGEFNKEALLRQLLDQGEELRGPTALVCRLDFGQKEVASRETFVRMLDARLEQARLTMLDAWDEKYGNA